MSSVMVCHTMPSIQILHKHIYVHNMSVCVCITYQSMLEVYVVRDDHSIRVAIVYQKLHLLNPLSITEHVDAMVKLIQRNS